MSDPVYIPDHAARGVALLLQQLRNSASHAGLYGVVGAEIQRLEDAFFTLYTGRGVSGAVGVQVDGLGSIVGETRNGDEDAAFLARIQSKIVLNRGAGEIETIIRVLLPLLSSGTVVVTEYPPAAFIASVTGLSSSLVSTVVRLLGLAKAGGVRALLEYSFYPVGETFTLDESTGQAFDAGVFAGLT